MHITCEKLTYTVKTLKKKFLGKGVGQKIRSNLYKPLVQFSYPLSFFISTIYLFPFVLKSFVYSNFALFIYYVVGSLCRLIKKFKNFILSKIFLRGHRFSNPHNSCHIVFGVPCPIQSSPIIRRVFTPPVQFS